MDKRLIVAVLAVFAGTSCWTFRVYSAGSAVNRANTEPLVVEMEEISVFDAPDNASGLWSGQAVSTWGKGRSKVKAWPVLKSDKPICGELPLDMDGDGERERKLSFAIDESRGTGTGYDKMYFDVNGDSELEKNELLNRLKDTPEKLSKRSSNYKVVFETFKLVCGADDNKHNIEIMPTLWVYERDAKRVYFTATKCRRGIIKVDGNEYHAYLGGNRSITAGYDKPRTGLYIACATDPLTAASWPGGDSLIATHNLGGRFYSFSATPRGDKLTVIPYAGDVGLLKVDAGKRQVEGEPTMTGSLALGQRSVALGGEFKGGPPEWVKECLLPVGDYLVNYVRVRFGGVEVVISNNYHSQAEERGRGGRSMVRGIEIRKHKPLVLDFSNEPEVIFTTVKQGMEVRPGQELEINAVLADPRLNIIVRGISEIRPGNPPARGKSLEPKMVITRRDGEVVAEGVMPFG